jgi:hypothetical protein
MQNFDWGTCPRCEKFGNLVYHKCPPQWEVWLVEEHLYGERADIAKTVYAEDEEAAAAEFARLWDREEPYLAKGYELLAYVVPANDEGATPKPFWVTGEMVPEYSAREARDKDVRRQLALPEESA